MENKNTDSYERSGRKWVPYLYNMSSHHCAVQNLLHNDYVIEEDLDYLSK